MSHPLVSNDPQSTSSISLRRLKTWARASSAEYRGLMPRTQLTLTQKGGSFELSVKRRVRFEEERRGNSLP